MSKSESQKPSDSGVKLPPLGPIHPGLYMSLLYLAAILLLLFLSLLYPGIKKYGTWYTVEALPQNASLYVDGARVGTTPGPFFVPAGERLIEVKKRGFISLRESIPVKGRYFLTLLFPRKETLTVTLTVDDFGSLVTESIKEFSDWSLALSQKSVTLVPSRRGRKPPLLIREIEKRREMKIEQYRAPPVVTEMVYDLYRSSAPPTPKEQEALLETLYASYRYPVDGYSMADLIAGTLIAEAEGKMPTYQTFFTFLEKHANFASTIEEYPLWIEMWLNKTGVKGGTQTSDSYLAELKEPDSGASRSSLSPFNNDFASIAGGLFLIGDISSSLKFSSEDHLYPPVVKRGEPFAFQKREVSNQEYYQFTQEVPRWSLENRDQLVTEKLVTDSYLSHWKGGAPEVSLLQESVTYISYYAAEAYAQWYSETFAPVGWEVRLPSEMEWIQAAQLGDVAHKYGIADQLQPGKGAPYLSQMAGSHWEWSSSWFAPYDYYFTRVPLPANVSSAGKVVKGGSSVGKVDFGAYHNLRGFQTPSTCSPYLSFRLAAVRR